MPRLGPNHRRWCSLHQAHYLTWVDAKHTRLARCPECEDEERRAEAAAMRREQIGQTTPRGDA